MFSGNSETELEGGCLRSAKRFQSGKRIRIETKRGSLSAAKGEDYELASHLDRGYCSEEEEYQLISKEAEEEETPNPYQDYSIPVTLHTSPKVISRRESPKVRSRNTSPSGFFILTNSNSGNRSQGTPTSVISN